MPDSALRTGLDARIVMSLGSSLKLRDSINTRGVFCRVTPLKKIAGEGGSDPTFWRRLPPAVPVRTALWGRSLLARHNEQNANGLHSAKSQTAGAHRYQLQGARRACDLAQTLRSLPREQRRST